MTSSVFGQPGWQKGRPKPITAVKSLFPADHLSEDLKRSDRTITEAARRADIDRGTVSDWLVSRSAPLAPRLIRFLDANGFDRGPYRSYLAASAEAAGRVVLVCPKCGIEREMRRGLFRGLEEQCGKTFPRLPDGRVQRTCLKCSRHENGLRAIKLMRRRKLLKRSGSLGKILDDQASQGEKQAQKKIDRLLEQRRVETVKPFTSAFPMTARKWKSEEHRRAIALGCIASVRITKTFSLCPLCGYIVYKHTWHRPCWNGWFRWYRRHLGSLPMSRKRPPGAGRPGPRPEINLKRNYSWLIIRRATGKQLNHLIEVHGENVSHKATVTKGIAAFVNLLPGSWDLVFSDSTMRSGNLVRKELISLPLAIQKAIDAGERDATIKRLHDFEMPEEEIARITGASVYRVKGIVRSEAEQTMPSPHETQATARIIHGQSRPHFSLCLLCGLLVYGKRRRFHRPCWKVARRGPQSAAQKAAAGKVRSNVLLAQYQALMSAGSVEKGNQFIELLPGSWDLVFVDPNFRSANRRRQKIIPLPAHRRDRSELIRPLMGMGMPADDVASLTGVAPARVQDLAGLKERTA